MVDTVDSLRVMVKLRWALRGQVPQLIGGTQRGGGIQNVHDFLGRLATGSWLEAD